MPVKDADFSAVDFNTGPHSAYALVREVLFCKIWCCQYSNTLVSNKFLLIVSQIKKPFAVEHNDTAQQREFQVALTHHSATKIAFKTRVGRVSVYFKKLGVPALHIVENDLGSIRDVRVRQ